MSRNAGLYGKIKTFHIFDILCWFSIMFSCCIWCILKQCLNSNINNSIKFTFFHLKCPIFIICDFAWGMTPCVTCLRVRDDGCTRCNYGGGFWGGSIIFRGERAYSLFIRIPYIFTLITYFSTQLLLIFRPFKWFYLGTIICISFGSTPPMFTFVMAPV